MRAAPTEGEANAALVRLIAKALDVPRARPSSIDRRRHRARQAHRHRRRRRDADRAAGEIDGSALRTLRGQRSGRSNMSATIIDGKAIAQDLRAKIAKAAADAEKQARPRAGTRRGARRQRSGERSLCPLEVESRDRCRHAIFRSQAAGRRDASRAAWRWSRNSMPTRVCTAFWCSCRCRKQIDSGAGAQRHRSGQGRRRLSSGQCRPARDRPAARWCRARRSARCDWRKRSIHRCPE